jgi:hypothetical protein
MTRGSVLRTILIAGTAFVGLTAVPGGAMLLLGIYSPPVEMLRGSAFSSFTIPGLTLAVVVGGSALLATTLLLRRSNLGFFSAAVAGLIVMTFEFVQVISIGSPAGPSRVMQILYFGIGLLLVGAATGALVSSPSDDSSRQRSERGATET